MAGAGKGGGAKGGRGGQATNADLQDDEDILNRTFRGDRFREWAKKKKMELAKVGPFINYSKSNMPMAKK